MKMKQDDVLDADDVIAQIACALTEAEGDFIENIANQVLDRKVVYIADSLFRYTEDKE